MDMIKMANAINEILNAGGALERDNDGQVVIYTGVELDETSNIKEIKSEDD